MTDNIDMRTTVAPKSDQLNADDLLGQPPKTITITKVTGNESAEQPISIHFEGDNGKPYKPCKSMRRVMIHVWKHNTKDYIGRKLTLICDPSVKFGGMEVGGIRILNMSHMSGPMTMALTATKASKKPYRVEPLKEDEELTALTLAGTAAAKKGSDAYIAWKDSLTAAQKEKIKPLHSGWAKDAKAADEENAPPPAPPGPVEGSETTDEELPL
jgi:hypothetical protein